MSIASRAATIIADIVMQCAWRSDSDGPPIIPGKI